MCSCDEQLINKTINNSTYSKTFKAKQRIRLDGGKMAKNMLKIPTSLYNEIRKAARERHKSLEEYKDELGFFLLLGQFEA